MVPLLVVLLLTKIPGREYFALGVFLLAALTDWLDGWWARRYKKITTLGMLLDPIADKLLVSAALVSLVELREAAAWCVCIILGREFAVSGLRSIASSEGITIVASKWGKLKMISQVVAISLMILGVKLEEIGLWHELGIISLYVMTGVALFSGIDYFRKFLRPVLDSVREYPEEHEGAEPGSGGASRTAAESPVSKPKLHAV